ncbi:MAG: hypothetical protein IT165_06560 [Bryobacterales bacterium]|nr:hypothetical protein [Bryobacterales bacterium]
MEERQYIVRYRSDGNTCGVMINAASPETAKELVRQEHQRSFRIEGVENVAEGSTVYSVLAEDRRDGTRYKLVVAAADENEAQRKAFEELGVEIVPCACQTCSGVASPTARIVGIVDLTGEETPTGVDSGTLLEAK